MRGTITGGMLNATAIALATTYSLALLPVLFLGFVAHADYDYLDCPGAMQCSDAASVRTMAVVYVLAAPVIWLLFKALRAAARRLRTEQNV